MGSINRLVGTVEAGPWPRLRASDRGRRVLGITTLALWVVAIGAMGLALNRNPTPLNSVLFAVLLTLCAVSHLQTSALNWSRTWNWRQAMMLLYSSRYLSEIRGVAGRDAFLVALESVAHRSAPDGAEPALVLVSIPRLTALRSEMGDLGGRKAVENVAKGIKRMTRADDLVGYLGDGRFGVILANCSIEDREQYLRRLPQHVEVTIADVTKSLAVRVDGLDLKPGYAALSGDDVGLDLAGFQGAQGANG